ncbi:MAG: cation:proton antiporter, partial [Oscillospiraceae bacterium]|nr:cation:proton antiporter [Oscillospiraceae bacterium]
KERFAQLVFGTLVIEDIAGIFMMVILSTVSVSQNISGSALAVQLGLLVLYLALWLILGIYILPTLLRKSADFMNNEVLLLVSLGICFGMVLLAEHLGFSAALGAFLAGSLLAGTIHAERVEHLTSGIKDLFGSIFFLSVGMLIDPAMLVKYIVPIIIISIVTIIGKLTISALGVLLSGQSLKTAVQCGSSLAQIGEFAFIIASLGMSLGVIADYAYPIVVAVSVITTLTTPFCIKGADRLYETIVKLLPAPLAAKLNRYTEEDGSEKDADSDWANFLRRYVKTTALYGVLMAGVLLIGQLVVFPFLMEVLPDTRIARGGAVIFCIVGIALFIRPMLDLRSTEYTLLWVKNRFFHLPLITLTALRFMLIVLLAFTPLQTILGINGIWLLPIIMAAVIVIYKSGWMSSAYIHAEAQFMANFNERNLHREDDDTTEWLDDKLFVQQLPCNADWAGKTLKQIGWGKNFGVNIIKIVHGKKHINMPSGDLSLRVGDTLYLLGKSEDLRSLRLALGLPESETLPTLHEFINSQTDEATNVYSYALPVTKDSELQGKTIKSSGLREQYDCMILGLQRNKLPILKPDINMVLQTDDLVWVLGSGRMIEKLLASSLAEV